MLETRGLPGAWRGALFAAACTLVTPAAMAQVQVFQHCDFGGWQASFSATGNFNTADLVARGGIDNDASSVKVAPGFKVTLFDGNNQTGRSVVLTAGNTACLVGNSFNDVLSSLRIEADGGANNVVQLFQHCNFGGWQANFPVGTFNTADIVARGGVNNDASSIKISPGFKATLFDGNTQTGRSIVLTANDACFVADSFNDLLSSLKVEAAGGGGGDDCAGVITQIQEDWFEHNLLIKRVSCDANAALFYDDDVNRTDAAWLQSLVSRQWAYFKQTYGSFGPDPRIYSFHHQNKFFGGHPADRFSPLHHFLSSSDIGVASWVENGGNHDISTHEICHVVEGGNNNVHGSPAFPVWGDSKWAEFCQFDLYNALGMTDDVSRTMTKFTNTQDNFPQPGTHWFRDWFFPLWRDHGHAQVMVRFFGLLAQNFPKHTANHGNGDHLDYDRDLNLGEFIHFMSGAAGTNLSNQAHTAFGSGWEAQFTKARTDFPGVTYP
jgi:hypothetical protein